MTKARDLGDNAQNTKPKVVDAKGDLIVGTGSDAANRLATGSNGDTLVADSAATTGLRWQPSMAAGKNAIINGAMDIWQRGTSFAIAANTKTFAADRWIVYRTATGSTASRQTTSLNGFTYSLRLQRDSGNSSTAEIFAAQNVDIQTAMPLIGQPITFSFWARAGANYSPTGGALVVRLNTGTNSTDHDGFLAGYTGGVNIIDSTATLTTSWQRFTYTATIGTTMTQFYIQYFSSPTGTASTNDWYEITGVQVELGSRATNFTRAGGTLQGELAACQRYYWRAGGDGTYTNYGWARGIGTTTVRASIQCPVQMRVAPTAVEFSNLGVGDMVSVSSAITGLTLSEAGKYVTLLEGTGATGLTAGTIYAFRSNNSSSGYVALSAEL